MDFIAKRRLLNAEAAEYLRKSQSSLNNDRASGRPAIPFYKVGGLIQYAVEDLDRYLASCRVEAQPARDAAGNRGAQAVGVEAAA